jgi:hypothetical protein
MSNRHSLKPDKFVFMDEQEIAEALSTMEQDSLLKTGPVLIKDADNCMRLVSFHEKHAGYLRAHPKVNPAHYLANLHAMVKIRA